MIRRPEVELVLEELVLHGFPAADRGRVRAAVEEALARRIAEAGLPPALAGGGALARLEGGSFAVERGASPEAIGARVAEAIVSAAGAGGGR